MKKLLRLYRVEMIRPILYKCVNRCAIALAVILLWDRYVNKGMLTVPDGLFVAAVFLMGWSWINYLYFDGIRIPYLFREKKKKPRRHTTSDIVDFVDEHITTFDELDDDEQLACRLASNAISGLIFLVGSVIGMVF